jgi:putative transposon-encoded protein
MYGFQGRARKGTTGFTDIEEPYERFNTPISSSIRILIPRKSIGT